MANNYVLLSSTVLQTNAASVTLSNIPTTGYSNLKIKVSARSTRSNPTDTMNIRPNGDSANSLYTQLYGYGNTGLTATGSGTSGMFDAIPAATATDGYFGTCEIDILGYSASAHKPIRIVGGSPTTTNTTWQINDTSFLWQVNTAISSITFVTDVGSFVLGSNFAIYGLAAEAQTPVSPKATGGDIVISDGTYWYHAFWASGTFTPISALTCDYAVVAGGGSGGFKIGGGGGAGGFRASTSNALLATEYPVLIGAGGAGATATFVGQGTNSSINSFVSTGGGYGGSGDAGSSAGSGGSGGGGPHVPGGQTGGTGNTPSTSPSQGNNGGNGAYGGGPMAFTGGGGGAGAVGANATTSNSGNGGAGSSTYNSINISTWLSATNSGEGNLVAGGGGGGCNNSNGSPGSGGAGGGGAGGGNSAATAGTVNTGSGGGGGRNDNNAAGRGGSGLVIVRYTV
jgi:hypothetical protein